jgi:NAD(P)-dependent dehydrogenase (short-subunit alcohol dehydrogenase family)
MNADSSSVLITGASTGIGHSTATRLAEAGWRVFAGVRDTAGARLEGVEVVELDVTSADSIASALAHVGERTGGRLDALVNNAGIPVAGAVETVPVEDFRELIETNLIGSFAVTKAFLPLVRHARGRIVFVGSLGGRVAFPYASAYHASKFGIEGLAESLRSEMRPLGVSVSVIEPATMATEIWGKGREQLSAVRASLTAEQREVYGEALEGFDRTLASADDDGEDPSEVAETIEKALTASSPHDRYLVGRGARAVTLLEPLLPSAVFDRVKKRVAAAG